jgi:hypothetical protein
MARQNRLAYRLTPLIVGLIARDSFARRGDCPRLHYDLRHAAVSLWLNAGVPATPVAQWAGHSVHVLLKVYASCIDGQDEAARKRIEGALGTELIEGPESADT